MDNFLIAKATDVGVARQLNEDFMTVFESPNGTVLAVLDGMGGQAAGDVASRMSAEIIESILTDNTFKTPEEAIRYSISAANQGVLRKTAQNPELEGMGSTCVMLIIKDGYVSCGWVGDSRIYYITDNSIKQISHDQSYVQQLIDSGQLSAAEAVNHPQKNEITNCIGLQGMTPPATIAAPMVPEPGSVFLLCTDGLSGLVDEKQIESVVKSPNMTLQQKAERLVALANEAGGLDNITVELVQFASPETVAEHNKKASKTNNAKKRLLDRALYYTIAFLLIGVICASGLYFFKSKTTPKNDNPQHTTTHTQRSAKPEAAKTDTNDNPTPRQSSTQRQPAKKDDKNNVKLPVRGKKTNPIQDKISGKKEEKPLPPKKTDPEIPEYKGNEK